MAPSNWVEITDRDGWLKTFPLDKTLLYIGSDAGNDIVLDARRGGGVASRHLQLIQTAAGIATGSTGQGPKAAYRAINLGDRDITVGETRGRSLAPRSAMNLVDGDNLRLGDFGLVFHLDSTPAAPARVQMPVAESAAPVGRRPVAQAAPPAMPSPRVVGVAESSPHIGLELSLPQARVDPERPLEGFITVRNRGDEPGVQFRLEVEGLDPDYYEIGAGPILFPQVEKSVYLRLHHPRGPAMAAGQHRVQIHASAPDAYPGEVASLSYEIKVPPYHRHTLALVEVD